MKRTYLVEIDQDVSSVSEDQAMAEDITDACEQLGIPVLSCKPWLAPSQLSATPTPLGSDPTGATQS